MDVERQHRGVRVAKSHEREGVPFHTLSRYDFRRARVLPDERTGGTLTHRRPGWLKPLFDPTN